MTERKHLAYICAPFRGDVKNNIINAIQFGRFVYEHGRVPIIPHVMFPFLEDDVKEEREIAMEMDMDLLSKCDEIWVFGTLTTGMEKEFEFAKSNGIESFWFTKEKIDKYIDTLSINMLRTQADINMKFSDNCKNDVFKRICIQNANVMNKIADKMEDEND